MSKQISKPTSMVSRRILNTNELQRQNLLSDQTRHQNNNNNNSSDNQDSGTPKAAGNNSLNMSSKQHRLKPFGKNEAVEQPPPGGSSQDAAGDSTVVHKDRNGTITVQSTKTVGKSNYSFVSVSPTKKTIVDSQQMKHIQIIQQNESRSWTGLQVPFTQRPGIGNIHTNRKYTKMSEYFKLEDERFKCFLELVNRVKDCEEEKLASPQNLRCNPICSGHIGPYTALTQPLQDKITQAPSSMAGQPVGPPQPRIQEFVNFKMPKDLALINRDNINMLCFTKPSQYEQSQFDMFFKMVKADARLVKAVFETNGMNQTEGNEWNVQWTSQSVKSFVYESMNEYQKINHFPMSNELTRKDRLCENVVKMQERFGKETFNILPDSYILPDEFADFYSHFHSLRSKDLTNMWIIKPQNSSQGKGIYIIDDISEVPIDEQCIISRYVANPFLINGLKFDLRLYVCVTSMDPWRIYMYNEGLVRFASEPYDCSLGKGAKYSHLTNFSINKKNERYVNNASADLDDCGHKWSLNALTRHLEQVGIDMDLMWSRIYDVVLKSLICVDGHIQTQLKKMTHKNNCFELLGYDVLIDQDLKPWLMEVNLSPSLATESPLDLKIKSQLFVDTMNLISMRKFDRRRENITKMKNRFKNIMRAKSYQSRQNHPNSAAASKHGVLGEDKARRRELDDWIGENKKQQAVERITAMNTRFRDIVRETLIENQRKNNFIRIYPNRHSDIYDQFFAQQRPLHKLLHKALFSDEFIPFQSNYPLIPVQRRNDTESSDQASLQSVISANIMSAPSTFNRSVTTGRDGGSHTNHSERVVSGPGSPSKKYGESGSHLISLHPIIPEEASESLGSTAKKSRVLKTAVDPSKFDEEDPNNQPYGLQTRESNTGVAGAHESERNNSTAKSAKRQQHEINRRTTSSKVGGAKQGGNPAVGSGSTGQPSNGSSALQQLSNGKGTVSSSKEVSGTTTQLSCQSQGQTQNNGGASGGTSGSDARRQGVLQSTADLQSAAVGNREKLLITGDDVLIEYVHRLMIAVQSIKEVMLKPTWKHQIEKFIKHYVWHTSDVRRAANNKLWQRLESRLIEMKERRKRLLQNIYLREKNMDTNLPKINSNESEEQDYSLEFQKEYETKEAQKNVIIQGFSASQLEEMLRTSTRNVAYEVISCLIDANGRGVLTEIIKFLTISNKHIIEVEENCSSILDNLNKKSHSHYGRHHNYYQNSKYGNKVARIDESEEDCESYANINVNLAVTNPKKAYQATGSSSGMGMAGPNGTQNSTGTNNSTLGISSSAQHQAGSNNDIRIKIRKNSIEPHLIAKANHKQIMRQRILKEQQQRQMMQISSNGNPSTVQGTQGENSAQLNKEDFSDHLNGVSNSGAAQTTDKNAFTPRTTSQRQASRSFKHQSEHHSESFNNQQTQNRDLQDSQFSIEDLAVRQKKNSEKITGLTATGNSFVAKANANNLFENSTSRDQLGKSSQENGAISSVDEKGTFERSLHVSHVSKTARCVDSSQTSQAMVDGKVPKVSAAGGKHLNRDLIASSENLNDFSPKNGGRVNKGQGASTLQSSSGLQAPSQAATSASRTSNNQSQYLVKLLQDPANISNQTGITIEGHKDVKIRNEPRGRLGNFKKSSNANSAIATGGNDEMRIRRTELSGQIPSSTSIQSLQKQQQQPSGSATSAAAQGSISSNAPAHATDTSIAYQSKNASSAEQQTSSEVVPPSPGKSLRESRAQMAIAQSPTPISTLGVLSSSNAVSEVAKHTLPSSQTEKKGAESKKSGSHAAKIGKGSIKVVKRNLIQSSELAQRGDVNGHEGGSNEQSSSLKRSFNARGSSSKGGGGAKGNGNRQHKF